MTTPSREQVFAAVRAGWGAVLVLGPDAVVRALSGQPSTRAARNVARVLGVRHVLQAVATLRWPSPTARDLGLVTDLLHAASGLGFALLPTSWRRGALLDASLATAFAASDAVVIVSEPAP